MYVLLRNTFSQDLGSVEEQPIITRERNEAKNSNQNALYFVRPPTTAQHKKNYLGDTQYHVLRTLATKYHTTVQPPCGGTDSLSEQTTDQTTQQINGNANSSAHILQLNQSTPHFAVEPLSSNKAREAFYFLPLEETLSVSTTYASGTFAV